MRALAGEKAQAMTTLTNLNLPDASRAVSLRTVGLIGLAVGVFGAALGLLEYLAPVQANSPSSLATPIPEFNHTAPVWQRVLVGLGHLLKSLAFLTVLYGVFSRERAKGVCCGW